MKIHRLSIVFFIVGLLFYMVGNGSLPITDPVESNYALTAKEMVTSGNWLSPQIYHVFWYDKPIMIYWLIAGAYKLFGFTAFAARFPSAVFGALSVAFFYQMMRTISGRRILSIWAALVLGTSLEFWVMGRGIITDMVLMFFTIGTMGYALRGLMEQKPRLLAVAYVFAGFGVLTKGPVALVLPGILLLAYCATQRSWTMVKRLFPWQGILGFLIVVLPWYGYMYAVHGKDFVDGFIGLNNVVRATESEHPEDNHWYYYLVIFLLAPLPWTGALLYGMWKGWKEKAPEYLYCMVWGWGTIIFYTLMATKYVTYTFISLIPFSVLAAIGIVRLTRVGESRKKWWFIVGPALFLWTLYVVATFFIGWGWWTLLYVIYAIGIAFVIGAFYDKKRYMLPLIVGAVTMAMSAIVIHEGLNPFVDMRSSVSLVKTVKAYDGPVYYYDGYSASLVFYTGKYIEEIRPAPTNVLPEKDRENGPARSHAWAGKYKNPSVPAEITLGELQSGTSMMIIVPIGRQTELFSQSALSPQVHLVYRTRHANVYVSNGVKSKVQSTVE